MKEAIEKTDPDKLKEKEIILSGDGSFTIYSKKYHQSYHSITGAITEKREKFVKAANVAMKAKKAMDKGRVLRVMDFCFGIGYNSLCMTHELVKNKVQCKVEIYAFEKDEEILRMMEKVKVPAEMKKEYDVLKVLILENLEDRDGTETGTIAGNEIKLILKVGDVRKKIKEISGNESWERDGFDAVFFDPFSPKMHPELWSKDVFSDVFSLMKKGGILTTYSCAGEVRRRMKAVGFEVKDGPTVGRRAPSSIAIKE